FVETRFLHRRPHEQRAVVPWDKIAMLAPCHASEYRTGFPREVQHLAANGPDRQFRGAFDGDLARPATSGDNHRVSRVRAACCLDVEIGAVPRDGADAAAVDEPCA